MATELKLRRGTTNQHSSFTGAEAEVTVDTDKETVVVHDGTTVGGYALAREDMSNVTGGDPSFDSINVDSGTLFVDSANNRVGVGTSSPSAPATVNRAGSDGDIVSFDKDGSTVGSIGTKASYTYIGTGETGVIFSNALSGSVYPWNTVTNSPRDAAVNLGASNGRFKDLYLSGGVYLGGTAAANKLDDYEEGVWGSSSSLVATNTGATAINVNKATYTKIGRLVTLRAHVTLTGGVLDTKGQYIEIDGNPFTPKVYGNSISPYIGSLAVGQVHVSNRNGSGFSWAQTGSTTLQFVLSSESAGSAFNTDAFVFTLSYITDS